MPQETKNPLDERAAEEKALWLAAIIESSDDAIISKNLDGIISSWNKGAERIFGYSAEEVIGKPITILIPADRPNEEPAILERLRRGERIDHYETVRRRKDGSLIDVSLTVSPVRSNDGTIIGASKIARNITERKRSEAQIALLAREAEHRVKNILANVQATVHLSHSETAEGLKRVIEGRIQALANVHRLFVESHWTGAELHHLIAQELLPYRQEQDGRVQLAGSNLMLKPNAAQVIAVILHELATNATKYGAFSVPGGRVHVDWSRSSNDRLRLRWTESNGPPVSPPARRGFGLRVMESMVAGEKGELHLSWRPQGFSCELILPE